MVFTIRSWGEQVSQQHSDMGHDYRAIKCAFFEDVFTLSESTRILGP